MSNWVISQRMSFWNVPRRALCAGALLVTSATWMIAAPAAWARSVPLETSAFGQFQLTTTNSECKVSFRRRSGARAVILTVDTCIGDTPGLNMLGAVESLGYLKFPVVSAGTEFHLFEIKEARGGNATDLTDYYAVVVTPEGVWAGLLGSTNLATARAPLGANPPALVVEVPPTTSSAGERHRIRFGATVKTVLPPIPSQVLGRHEHTFEGFLNGGNGWSRWRPFLDTAGLRKSKTLIGDEEETIIIDEPGQCSLDDHGGPSRVRVEITEWDDGRTAAKCLAIENLAAREPAP